MDISFHSVRIENFRSIRKAFVPLDDVGLVSIEGAVHGSSGFESNGAGKSSIPWAICWCLYGLIPGGIAGGGIMSTWSKSCSVVLSGVIDGARFSVERIRKGSTTDVVFSVGDGESKGKSKDVQSEIDRVFGTLHYFLNSVLFGSRVVGFTKSSGEEKKKIFNEIIGLDEYRAAKDKAWSDMKLIKQGMLLASDRISSAEGSIKILTGLMVSDDDVRDARNELAGVESSILDKYDCSYDDLESSLSGLDSIVSTERDLLAKSRSVKSKYEFVLESLNDSLDKMSDIDAGSVCSECMQIIDGEHKKREVKKLKAKISDHKSKAPLVDPSRYNTAVEYCDGAREVIHEYERAKSELSKVLLANSKTSDAMAEVNEKKITNEKKLKVLKKRRVEAEYAHKALSDTGIPSLLMDKLVPALNESSAKYMRVMFPQAYLSFSTDSGKSDRFVFLSHKIDGTDYKLMSEGERARVDLCAAMAIQESSSGTSGRSFNIRFYDEVFDGMDDAGMENVVMMLSERVSKVKSIFVISHLGQIRDMLPSRILVTKRLVGGNMESSVNSVEG